MFDWFCSAAALYTAEEFFNLLSAIGTLATGVGTILLGWAATKTIPKLLQRNKSAEVIQLYQRVVYRLYKDVESSETGMMFSLPKDLDELTDLLVSKHPQIGSIESARKLMDDLMMDGYFKTVVGHSPIVEPTKWKARK